MYYKSLMQPECAVCVDNSNALYILLLMQSCLTLSLTHRALAH